jgi:hypothetical protein
MPCENQSPRLSLLDLFQLSHSMTAPLLIEQTSHLLKAEDSIP